MPGLSTTSSLMNHFLSPRFSLTPVQRSPAPWKSKPERALIWVLKGSRQLGGSWFPLLMKRPGQHAHGPLDIPHPPCSCRRVSPATSISGRPLDPCPTPAAMGWERSTPTIAFSVSSRAAGLGDFVPGLVGPVFPESQTRPRPEPRRLYRERRQRPIFRPRAGDSATVTFHRRLISCRISPGRITARIETSASRS